MALGAYLTTLALDLGVLWPRRWYGISPSELRDELSEAASVVVVGDVTGAKVSIYERNHRKVRSKAVLWMASVVFLVIGSTFSVWTTIVESPR